MKKLLLELSFFVFAFSFLACCTMSKKDKNIKADKGNFIVLKIDAVENDSSKVLCKYTIVSDTLSSEQGIQNEQTAYNPFKLVLTDTSGKYKIGDTLFLGLKITPTE